MSDDPLPFTDGQRAGFGKVGALIRADPVAFLAAGRWLDAGAGLPSVERSVEMTRQAWLRGARSRRQVGKAQGRDAGRAYLVPVSSAESLSNSRKRLARDIRSDRDEAARAPAQYSILQSAVDSLLAQPPNYDAMRPDIADGHARRVMLVAWILTDARPLKTDPSITVLQDWEWGAHALEFLNNWPKNGLPMPRLFARTTLLDKNLEAWADMVSEALRYLDVTSEKVPQPTHSEDFTFVKWYGTEYTFALGVQTAVVRALWTEWEKTGFGLHQETIGTAVDAERENFRMDKTFRSHPAFGRMITSVGDGRYKLTAPGQKQSEPGIHEREESARIPPKARRKPL